MIAVLVGVIFILLGLIGILHWMGDLMSVLRGILPLALVLGGIVGVIAGVASLQARKKGNEKKK